MTRIACAASVLTLCALSCATAPIPHQAYEELAGLDRNFFVRQRVEVRFGDEERRFETALQSRCGELRLVGLSPFGMRLFTAVRRDGEVEVETLADQHLPFSPTHVLRDVERTFFRSLPTPSGDATRSVFRLAEQIDETWRDGVLVLREIRPSGEPNSQPIVIRYSGERSPAGISSRIDLANPHFGYVLAIHNFEMRELTCPAPDAP